MPQCLQCVRDRCGMVAKIVNHLYAPHFASNFQSPRNTGKTLQRAVDFGGRHVIKARSHHSHRSIVDIEFADQRNFESFFSKLEPRARGRISDVPDSLRAIFGEADLDHLRQAILCDLDAIWIIAIQKHHSILRNDVEQTPKAELDFIEILEDVRMIKLDVVYDQQFRQIMNEFGTLVERRSVVLVALNREGFGIVQTRHLSKIFSQYGNSVTGVAAALPDGAGSVPGE